MTVNRRNSGEKKEPSHDRRRRIKRDEKARETAMRFIVPVLLALLALLVTLFFWKYGFGGRAPFVFCFLVHLCWSLGMSALFNFQSLLLVVLLLVCTCAYVHAQTPSLLDRNKTGFRGLFWKFARVGERMSPYVSLCCIAMGLKILFA